jgi:hypothetical protein
MNSWHRGSLTIAVVHVAIPLVEMGVEQAGQFDFPFEPAECNLWLQGEPLESPFLERSQFSRVV